MSKSFHHKTSALLALAALGGAAAPAGAQALKAQRIVTDAESAPAAAPESAAAAAAATPAPAARASGTAASQRAAMLPAHIAPMLSSGRPVAAQFGAKGFRPEASRLSFSVVRRNADGSLTRQCVTGEDAAEHALHGGATTPGDDHAAH